MSNLPPSDRLLAAMSRVLEHTDGSKEAEYAVLTLCAESVLGFMESVRRALLTKTEGLSAREREAIMKLAEAFDLGATAGVTRGH